MSKSWRPPAQRFAPIHDTRPFWLFSLLLTLLIVVVSYFVAVFMFLVLLKISELPKGPLWDAALQPAFLFVLMAVVVGLLLVPYFQKEWDPSLRTFSMFAATFLVAYAVFRASGFVDPNIPLNAFLKYVIDPLRHSLGH